MRRSAALLAVVLICAVRSASAAACNEFSLVPSDHAKVKYSAWLPLGATYTSPLVSVNGSQVAVSRNISGGSLNNQVCVEDTVDLGSLAAGHYNLTWSDNGAFMAQRTDFAFAVGSPVALGTYLQPVDTEVLAPAVPGEAVRLLVNVCELSKGVVSAPVAAVSGNEIHVTQQVTAGGNSDACAMFIIDLGELPVATYHVTTTRTYPASNYTNTYGFGFIVQQPQRTAPCNGLQSVTSTARGTARLRYEGEYYGVAPSYGPPSVTSTACCDLGGWETIKITQPVTDVAGASRMYQCHGEELDLGPLQDGVYTIDWHYAPEASIPGSIIPPAALSVFRWSSGMMQCSNLSVLTTSGSLLANQPLEIVRTQLTQWGGGLVRVAIAGSLITIDEVAIEEGPIPLGPPQCSSTRVPIGSLLAADYLVHWNVHYRVSNRDENYALQFSVTNPAPPGRSRAARH